MPVTQPPLSVSRRAFLQGSGCLLVTYAMPLTVRRAAAAAGPGGDAGSKLVPDDQVDSFIAITAEGNIVACNGHVDLGTGLRTAFSQMVADELDVSMERVSMVLGDTDRTPNQGPTIASASVQTSSVPMRKAAAQARRYLIEQAARRLDVPADQLSVTDGVISAGDGGPGLSYGELVQGQAFAMELDEDVPLKDSKDYMLVGKSVPRLDIPAKLTGGLVYVHDMRVPGMLHARVVRPPYRGRDAGDMVGTSLQAVDKQSVAHIASLVDVVVEKDFVAVVAEREEDAIDAARALKVDWATPPPLLDLSDLTQALRGHAHEVRPLEQKGDIEAAMEGAQDVLRATYVWPFQLHASIGPSCGLAQWRDERLTVWSGSQNPHNLHADIAELLDLAEEKIRVVRMEASGCYGRNCADDAAAEAALLAYRLGRPVRVQLMREEEHGWEPKGTAQLMEVVGGITGEDTLAYQFTTRYPSNGSPTLPLLMVGKRPSTPTTFEMGDRTAIPQYRCSATDIKAFDMAPIVRASWIRGVAALPNVFAHESFIDELAATQNADPVQFRLRFMEDERPIALVKAVAERAQWVSRPAHDAERRNDNGWLLGRGFSQHRYIHGQFPGTGAAWCAWAVEVEVDPDTGYVRVIKAVVGQDCGQLINPAGVVHQVHGNIIQATSRSLKESVLFDERGTVDLEWGSYPILSFPEVPDIDVVLMPANGNPPLGAGESSSVPGAAAIANAIFDATGLRLREAPFTPQRVKAAFRAQQEGNA